jgi:hypothetical protein
MTRFWYVAVLTLCWWSVPVVAQVERGELRLGVTDAIGLPVPASGTLTSEAPQLYREFSTDESGRFTLQDLPFGRYRLTIEQAGFATHSEIVEVHSAVPKSVTIHLQLSLTAQVHVSDTPPLVDAARTGVAFSIGAPQIQDALPAIPGRRLLDLVDAQPGWLMEANGVLHPRGSEYQTLFVIDGVPMDENRSPAFTPDLQDGDVQAVHVMTGNFPAEYGRKLGGVVEVTTARDIRRGLHAAADAGTGSFGTAAGSLTAGYGWTSRALRAGVSAARTGRYLDPPLEENFTNAGSLGGVTVSYDDRPGDADRFRLTWHRRGTSFLVPNERLQQSAGQRQRRTGREDLGQAAWTRVIGSRLVFNGRGVLERLTAGLESNAHATPIAVSQDRHLTRRYVGASMAADLGRHQVKFGGDVVDASVGEALAYAVTDPSAFDPDTPASFDFSDNGRDREQSLFVQDTTRIGPFTASAGLRWDRYAFMVRDHAFSPRLGLAWSSPGGTLVLRAAYDRVFQTPAVENLLLASSPAVDALGTAVRIPVQPSRGHFVEGGVTAAVISRARVDVTAYRRTLSQFADDDVFLNTGVSFPVAFEAARIRGVDSKLTVLPIGPVSGFVSYSLLSGTARLPVVGGLFLGDEAVEALEERGDVAITQDQRHTVRAQIRYALTRALWGAATLRYGSGLPVELGGDVDRELLVAQLGNRIVDRVDLEGGRVRPNVAVDAGVGARLFDGGGARVSLRVEIANLTNRLNVINFAGLFSGTALGAPRSAMARLQVEF